MLVKSKNGHWNQRDRLIEWTYKHSHPRFQCGQQLDCLNKQGCKWENDDNIQLRKIKKKCNHERL